jgi:oligoendopeptidase F
MINDQFFSNVLKQLSSRLEEIEKRHRYLSFLIEKRFANEKLLQLETMHNLQLEFWIEIKMRPTNYRKPGHAKAITNGVAQVIEDIQRLKRVTDRNTRRFAMFAFYPIYAENYRTFNEIHLKRISQEAGKNIENPMMTVKVGEADFNLYVVEV